MENNHVIPILCSKILCISWFKCHLLCEIFPCFATLGELFHSSGLFYYINVIAALSLNYDSIIYASASISCTILCAPEGKGHISFGTVSCR